MVHTIAAEIEPVDLGEKLDQNCNIDTKKKKKKSSKKKAAAVTPLSSFYQKALASYPVKLNNTKVKGRHAVAEIGLEEGTTLCQEQATAFVVRSEYIDQQCHVCLSDLKQKMMCSDCKKTFYCSQDCLEKDNDLHVLICAPIAQTEAIGRATDVDADLLRLMTLLMARRYLDTQNQDSTEDATIQPTPYWCVEDLISHRDNAEPAFIKVLTEASQRLVMEMSDQIQMPVDDMVTLACRINSNAHGLGDNHSRNTDVALGLFPLGALFFNHGCNPNTAFVGVSNGQLAFRTIRPVNKDEELVVSYIDLYSDRDERRLELLQSKHFWCKCKRCASPMEKSVDRFLQGVVCTKCKEDVYIIPATSVEHLSKGSRNLYLEQGSFKCGKCGFEASCDQVRKPLENASKSYMLGMNAIRQERNYRRGAEKLEQITKCDNKRGGDLHALNAFRLNSLIPLMNCKRHNGDLKGAIEVNRLILAMMEQYASEGLLPANTSEISDFWQNLGELCSSMANESRGRSSILEKKWLKEARTAFSRVLAVRSVVFGKTHPKTKLVEEYIATLPSS
ncbi:SET domain-containing protein [Mucor ambiguus]|uniref:SET domain-containing protein n=1 Tax=Mucor ambiguus TaxID=91626 RepID=A0A0C9MKK4_9FUNG|nr:SET domain-containing protein [Mucor ambiguus]